MVQEVFFRALWIRLSSLLFSSRTGYNIIIQKIEDWLRIQIVGANVHFELFLVENLWVQILESKGYYKGTFLKMDIPKNVGAGAPTLI